MTEPTPTLITGLPRMDQLFTQHVTEPDVPEELTAVRTVDSRTALARGLCEYYAMQSFMQEGGRLIQFKSVNFTWAESEQTADSPSLAIHPLGPGVYADASTTPHLVTGETDWNLVQTGAIEQEFQVTAWCTDVEQRVAMACMLEDAADPVEFMSGFRLALPFYFGTHAEYLVKNVIHQDAPADASRRWRLVMFGVSGHMPKYRRIGVLPSMHTELQLAVT